MARASAPLPSLPLEQARACWLKRQGLLTPLSLPLDALVAQTGWLRTLGGVEAYLALRARARQCTRAEVDEALQQRALEVLPAVRGCMYVLPQSQARVGLSFAHTLWLPRARREIEKVGAEWAEVETLAAQVLECLETGPLSPEALRKALPPGAVRSLGEAGKKLGLSSLLPTALRKLEFEALIARGVEGGRLDSERYLWGRSRTARAGTPLDDPTRVHAALAALFFAWQSPAPLRELADWSGLSLKEARAATLELELQEVQVPGFEEPLLALPEDLQPTEPGDSVHFLPFEDNYLVGRGTPAPLVSPAAHGIPVQAWGSARSSTALATTRHLAYRPILEAGELIGFWEYHPTRQEVESFLFSSPRRPDLVRQEAESLGVFLRDQLGHGRSFSLDTDESLLKRIDALSSLPKL